MKAVAVHEYGDATVVRPGDWPTPVPGQGEIRVRQTYAGVNFADIYQRLGLYAGDHTYGTRLPFVLGKEGVGVVDAVGPGVDCVAPGTRVGYFLAQGTYAEQVTVDSRYAVELPQQVDDRHAAALLLQGVTSDYLTHSLYALGSSDTCLVHAAMGGVGQLLVQMAKARGAAVIAAVGSAEKAARIKQLGADHVVEYQRESIAEAVLSWTSGQGVDVVYDSVGRDTIADSLKVLRVRGMCVLFGASSGPVEAVVPMDLAEAGSVTFCRPHLMHFCQSRGELQGRADRVFRDFVAGKLTREIYAEYPLEAAQAAHELLESRASTGKILLRADEPDSSAGSSTP